MKLNCVQQVSSQVRKMNTKLQRATLIGFFSDLGSSHSIVLQREPLALQSTPGPRTRTTDTTLTIGTTVEFLIWNHPIWNTPHMESPLGLSYFGIGQYSNFRHLEYGIGSGGHYSIVWVAKNGTWSVK